LINDTKNLRTLAEAATPGPWTTDWAEHDAPYQDVRIGTKLRNVCLVWMDDAPVRDYNEQQTVSAAYIAACSPDVLLSLLDALERKDAAIKKCYSEVIRGLADVVNVHTPDKLFDLDAIPRDPVMVIVSRIKTSMDAITKEIGT
jgi:hypothetical protein